MSGMDPLKLAALPALALAALACNVGGTAQPTRASPFDETQFAPAGTQQIDDAASPTGPAGETAEPSQEATAASSPPPTTASAYLEDDFDGSTSGRPLFGPEIMTVAFDSGELALTSLVPGIVPLMYDAPVVADFALEVDVRFPQARPGSVAGIVFRSDDAVDGLAHYYHLAFRPADRHLAFDLWKDGAWSSLGNASIDPGALDPDGADHLLLLADGEKIQVFVNDVFVLEATDEELSDPGIIGLSLAASASPETVYFDNLSAVALED